MTNRQRIRGPSKTFYHYLITHNNNDKKEYYKTINEIINKHNISRGNIYLMCKNPNLKRRTYTEFKIKKIHIHYLAIDQDIV